MHKAKLIQSLPLWKRVLRATFNGLEKVADKFNRTFPTPKHKRLNRYSRNGLLIHTDYIEVSTRNRVIAGTLYFTTITAVWCFLSVVNYKGFGSVSDGFLSILNPFNAVVFSASLRSYGLVFWSWALRTPVLIGDTDSDPKAEELAHKMRDAADAKKIKMRLIKQGRDMRAYFRNDDEAVLIRASA